MNTFLITNSTKLVRHSVRVGFFAFYPEMEDIQKQFDDYSKSIRLIESMLKNSKEQMAKLHQQFDEIYKDSKPGKYIFYKRKVI